LHLCEENRQRTYNIIGYIVPFGFVEIMAYDSTTEFFRGHVWANEADGKCAKRQWSSMKNVNEDFSTVCSYIKKLLNFSLEKATCGNLRLLSLASVTTLMGISVLKPKLCQRQK
jgi:hypothetical protein